VSKDCHVDIETFSKANLKQVGTYRYAEDPSTEVLCLMYAFGDEPVNVWIPDPMIPKDLRQRIRVMVEKKVPGALVHFGTKCPDRLRWHAGAGGRFWAYNAMFERRVLKGPAGRQIRFPKTKRNQWHCTMAQAKESGLPSDLGRCAKALKCKHQKDENGRGDMLRLSKPRKPSKLNPATRWWPDDVPDKFINLYSYCIDDVLTEREIHHDCHPITKNERKVYLLDQRINDRGWRVDLKGIDDVQYLIDSYKMRIEKKMLETAGMRPTQREKLVEWIRGKGVDMPNLQAPTVEDYLKKKDQPIEVRQALRMYSLYNMKAPAKYTAMERAVCADECLHGMFNFYGASTGRWSSVIVQLQNLFRPVIDDPEFAIELFSERELSVIKIWFSKNPMKVFASCVRGMLIAREGRDLLFADFSSIEARIVAWMANAIDKLKIFSTHGLVYEYTASKIWGHPLDLDSLKLFKKDHPDERFLGKIAELAFGYQGGQAAGVKMAKDFGADLTAEKADQVKWDWREANPEIVQMWENLKDAAILAVLKPGTTQQAHKLAFRVVGDYLYMRLPSGRKLAYYKPEIRNEELRYWGIDTYTRQWSLCKTYGGKLLQNAAEGIARDLMVAGMFNLYRRGIYPILGTVHDEIITEPREGVGTVEEVEQLMTVPLPWAKGLPIKAVGERCKRYKK
jgi:DNA polymerase